MLQRSQLLPLHRLSRLFGIPGAEEDPTQTLVIIVEDGSMKAGLVVDAIVGQQQTVIKQEHVVPAIKTRRYIRVWDAGCAMGPEPYSLAILMREKCLSHQLRSFDLMEFWKLMSGDY